MKLVVVTGTRPNFVKEYAFGRACVRALIDEVVIHTGQHYDRNMSDAFFKELDLRQPDYINDLVQSTPARELSDIMIFVEGVLAQEKPDAVVVYGDVTSTMAAAMASGRLGIPVAHVEAGARAPAFIRNNPEEINRRVAELLADTLLPHIAEAKDALLASGFPEDRIFLTGDIMLDSLRLAMAEHDIELTNKGYVLASTHRAENTDDPVRLEAICRALAACPKDVIFPVHPRTDNALQRFRLKHILEEATHILLLPPQSYLANLRLLAGADRVASDSGGLRREGYMLGKPVVSLTDIVWVPSMVREGWEWVAGPDTENILHGLTAFTPPDERSEIFGDGRAADRIVEILLDRYGSAKEATINATGLANAQSLVAAKLENHLDMECLPRRIKSRTLVSIVTPCYNEEESLPTYFHRVKQLARTVDRNRFALEFVVVNDCSRDHTSTMLDEFFAGRRDAVVVHNSKNMGLGGAIKQGFAYATGEIMVTIDADTNYDLLDTPKLLDFMGDSVDLVTGSPFMEGGDWNYPAHRFLMSRGVVMLYRLVLGCKARDIRTFTCGFRAYRRRVLPVVTPKADDFLATAEMLVRALLADCTVVEVPVVNYERKFGVSKMKTFRTIKRHLAFLSELQMKRIRYR